MLKQELTNYEMKLNLLLDAQASVEQNMEELSARRDLISEEIELVVALRVKIGQVW